MDGTEVVSAGLRDPAGLWADRSSLDVATIIATASRHRVLLLLGWLLRDAGVLHEWPGFAGVFESAERHALSVDCVRQAELTRVLRELDDAEVRAIVFKGAALAHTHYPAPHVRVRADSDLFAAEEDVPALEKALGRLGYARPAETSGTLVSYQSHYQSVDRFGVAHALDVHWKISNLQALANCFTHSELWRCRLPLAALGSSAVTVDAPHALAIALVHRAGHHPGSRNLLWLYDLHVLERRLTASEQREFQAIVAARGLKSIASEGLSTARRLFGDQTSGASLEASDGPWTNDDGPMRPWTPAEVLRQDLQALPDWRTRGRLLREHLLPPSSYMRAKYGVRSNVMLPALYVWRALHGMPKWLRRPE
jgi:Uncharacterised nucleotidyltransferase